MVLPHLLDWLCLPQDLVLLLRLERLHSVPHEGIHTHPLSYTQTSAHEKYTSSLAQVVSRVSALLSVSVFVDYYANNGNDPQKNIHQASQGMDK